MKYLVYFSRTVNYCLEVEAESKDDAVKKARKQAIVMDGDELEENADYGYFEDFFAEEDTEQ